MSNSPGLVDFAIGLANSVLNLPDGGGHHTNICKFLQLPRAISLLAKDVSLSKMAISLILLKALFPVVLMDFP